LAALKHLRALSSVVIFCPIPNERRRGPPHCHPGVADRSRANTRARPQAPPRLGQTATDDEVCYGLPACERPPVTPSSRAGRLRPFVP
jgi:hypothetical protein